MFEVQFREAIGKAIPRIVECLKDPNNYVRRAAAEGLSSLRAYCTCPSVSLLLESRIFFEAQFQEAIRKAIPRIVECLKSSSPDDRSAAVCLLSSLGAYRTCPSISPLLVS